MKLAKVIGSVTSTVKVKEYKGITLLVIQPTNAKKEPLGSPIVAVDVFGAGPGEYVFFSKSKEGAMTLPNPKTCADAGICGIIDSVYVR